MKDQIPYKVLKKIFVKELKKRITELNDVLGLSLEITINKVTKIVYFIIDTNGEKIRNKKMYPIIFESRLVKKSKGKYIPLDKQLNKRTLNEINSKGEIYFYPKEKKFFYKNKFYNINQLLDYFNKLQFNIPIKTVCIILLRKIKLILAKILSKFLELILFLITGDSIKYKYESRFIALDSTKVDGGLIKPTEIKSFEVLAFGIKTKIWPIFVYSFLNIIGFLILNYLNIKLIFLKKIINNNFLVTCYVISSLTIFQTIIPFLLKKTIFNLINVYPDSFKSVPID